MLVVCRAKRMTIRRCKKNVNSCFPPTTDLLFLSLYACDFFRALKSSVCKASTYDSLHVNSYGLLVEQFFCALAVKTEICNKNVNTFAMCSVSEKKTPRAKCFLRKNKVYLRIVETLSVYVCRRITLEYYKTMYPEKI